MLRQLLIISFILVYSYAYTQERPVKIIDTTKANRLLLYAVNENEQDLDVKITVTGTGFRQSKGKARLIRVPATSKVNVKSLIIERGKTPSYTYELEVNDSLSRRALKKPFKLIKIEAMRPILVYLTERCVGCNSLIASIKESKYLFRTENLSDKPKMEEYLENTLKNTKTPLTSITNPIVSLGGKLYFDITTYEQLVEALSEE